MRPATDLDPPLSSSPKAACLAVAGVCAVALAFGADVRALAPLGEINLDCPAGMLAPTVRGPSERHSMLSLGLSKYADRIYIICTDECDAPVPEEFGDKVMLLNGYALDECNAIQGYDHWIKASQSHLHAVTHAMTTDADVILVLEQDSQADPEYGWADGNWAQLNQALDEHEWNMLRLGYRPLTFEMQPEMEACAPEACACQAVGEVLCWLPSAGCDLRASDAYLLHKRAFREYADGLRGGGVIDNGVLQRLGNQLVVAPQVMHQTRASSDFTSVEHQKAVSALFTERCQLGMTRTQAAAAAAAAAAALGGDEEAVPAAGLGETPHAEERVSFAAGSRAYVSPDGERLNANTAVEAFGGLEAFLRIKARLGEGGARR